MESERSGTRLSLHEASKLGIAIFYFITLLYQKEYSTKAKGKWL